MVEDNGGELRGPSAPRRVTSVLYALAEREGGLSVRAIAEAIGTSRSSTHRILQMLADEGYAEQRDEGRYSVGPKLLELAGRVYGVVPIIRVADAIMTRLVKEVGETSYLATYEEGESHATFIHRVECDEPVRHVQALGSRRPLHAGAVGKAILSASRDIDVAKLDLTQYTPRTPISLTELERDVEFARERGYSISVEERVSGVAGIAAPLVVGGEVVGGLTVAIPTARIPSTGLEGVGEAVKRYAAELSSALKAMGTNRF